MFDRKSGFVMSDEILEAHIRGLIASQPDGAMELEFAWQGGEPTLRGIDFYRRALKLQKRHARPGLKIHNTLQTNGVLLDSDWGEFLGANNFMVGISIDGPREFHDCYRRSRRRFGSFERVVRGLRVLQEHKVEHNVLTVVHNRNAAHPLTTYRGLKDLGVERIQFIPLVEHISAGNVTTRSVPPGRYADFLMAIFDKWRCRDLGRVYIQQFEMPLAAILGVGEVICVHSPVCGRSIAVEYNGNVYACDHFVTPDHLLGNIGEQSYAALIEYPQQRQFGLKKQSGMDSRCRDCDVLKFCHGGCPAHRIVPRAAGRRNGNYLCRDYQAFFRHIRPHTEAMATAIRAGRWAGDYRMFMESGGHSL